MGDCFQGWRRKMGVVTLVLACSLMGGWLATSRSPNSFFLVWRTSDTTALRFGTRNSQFVVNSIDASLSLSLHSGINQAIAVWKDPASQTLNYPPQSDTEIPWTYRFGGFDFGKYVQDEPFQFRLRIWRFPYWAVVIPLTLLSAGLLIRRSSSIETENQVDEVVANGPIPMPELTHLCVPGRMDPSH